MHKFYSPYFVHEAGYNMDATGSSESRLGARYIQKIAVDGT